MPQTEEILIQSTAHECRAVRIVSGLVQDIEIERSGHRGFVGDVLLGKISRVLPGMQSAFVEVGFDRTAFLHVADVWQAKGQDAHAAQATQTTLTAQPAKPIEKILYEGQQLIVQVVKDPIGTKGARLTTQLSIAGRLLVYTPYESHLGISQRIGNEEDRERLKNRMKALIPADETGGFIVRTNAEDATDDALKQDIDYLRLRWQEILDRSRSTGPTPPAAGTKLYRELVLSQRVVRDWVSEQTRCVTVEGPNTLMEFAERYVPGVAPKLKFYKGDRPLFELHGVEDEIERALARRVDMKSGGYLIFDQTEALTTIDVNTGGYVSGRNFSETVFKTNLEATQVIARQMRLRNLGGIILIDFIDMESASQKEAVLLELQRAMEMDRTKVRALGFTQLGLVEVTRKRTRDSLAHMLCEPCPTCGGGGEIKTAQTICYEILREIRRMAQQFNPKEFRVLANAGVIDRFLDEESQHLATLGDTVGKPISLHVESGYSPAMYDIVLI